MAQRQNSERYRTYSLRVPVRRKCWAVRGQFCRCSTSVHELTAFPPVSPLSGSRFYSDLCPLGLESSNPNHAVWAAPGRSLRPVLCRFRGSCDKGNIDLHICKGGGGGRKKVKQILFLLSFLLSVFFLSFFFLCFLSLPVSLFLVSFFVSCLSFCFLCFRLCLFFVPALFLCLSFCPPPPPPPQPPPPLPPVSPSSLSLQS